MRQTETPENVPEQRFAAVPIDNLQLYLKRVVKGAIFVHDNGTLNMPIHVLCYTPKSNENDAIVQEAVKMLQLTGSRGYNTPDHMEYDLLKHNYIAGVVFKSTNIDTRTQEYPMVFKYSLRFPSELRTSNNTQILNWQTYRVFPMAAHLGPRNDKEIDGGVPVGYIAEGFLPIQHALTMSWLKLADESNFELLPQLQLKRFPYNPYIFDSLLLALGAIFPFFLVTCYIYPCTFITKYIAAEKEAQLKEIMKLLDLHNWLHWVAWFIKSYLVLFVITVIILVMLLVGINAPPVLPYSSFTALLFFFHFYIVASICFSFMVAAFFSKASSSAAILIIVWFISYMPFTYALMYYDKLGLAIKLILCFLFSNTALGFGAHIIVAFEQMGEGITWGNIFSSVSVDDNISLLHVIITLVLGSVLYMLICLYVEQIHPGHYGIAKKWYFPFQRKFMYPFTFAVVSQNNRDVPEEPCTCPPVQSEALEQRVGIRIRNLHKRFGDKVAVQDLSLNMYQDEITVLLGHNGAGKTTTIHMLTGIISPTSGTAYINGCDIRTELDCARSSLGICPQHNVLFGDMSVRNHIKFFSRLKGMEGEELKLEIKKYLVIMNLEKKQHTAASKLSGGMKRKLSLCCALCGNTKTVLCDEPSSGLDVAARRHLWDLLRAEKPGRTILLTTHYMDEADALADRIAIMSNGELKCYGTSFSLKNKYGSGYRLVCIKKPGCRSDKVTGFLSKYIPGIRPETEVGMELTYRLPTRSTSVYAEMFSALENELQRLQLDGYGISAASLEDVFEKTGADRYRNVGGHEVTNNVRLGYRSNRKRLVAGREHGIFDDDVYESRSGVRFVASAQSTPKVLQPLDISLKMFPSAYVVLEDNSGYETKEIADAYKKVVGKDAGLLNTKGSSFEDYILKESKENRALVDQKYVAGATISETNLTVWLNNKPLHTAPLTLNLMHNAMARKLLGSSARTHVVNDPLPFSQDTLQKRLKAVNAVGLQVALNLAMCMSYVVAFFVIPIIKERETRTKLLLFLTGVDVFLYWASHLLWDFVIFTLAVLLGLITIAIFQEPGFSTLEDMSRYLALLLIFILREGCSSLAVEKLSYGDACSIIPACCNIPPYFGSPEPGIRVEMIYLFIEGILLFVLLQVLDAKMCAGLQSFLNECCGVICCKAANRPEGGQDSARYKNDVQLERDAIANMTQDELNDLPLVVDRIRKKYGNIQAVKELSFYVAHSECFGLLGVNGAGKSTTFKMLTGDEVITSGDAYVDGISVRQNMSKVYDRIGYCPQYDALLEELTGGETMRLYCMLRGVRRRYIKDVCNDLASELGFIEHIDKPIKHYSGGNRRKLSVAIALITDPSVLYLDEPSAGMDPSARRKMWKVLAMIRELGKAIVLTSHCMEEVEALCMRIAIMVDGHFKCIGSTQYLKNKYSKGFILKIRVASGKATNTPQRPSTASHPRPSARASATIPRSSTRAPAPSPRASQGKSLSGPRERQQSGATNPNDFPCAKCTDNIRQIKKFIRENLPNAQLREEFRYQLTYFIPKQNANWPKIFNLIESNRVALNVEDYSITQMALDEMFLEFGNNPSKK
ncbi:ATP-binding cassette sub-family A member 3-like [Scaptodrosophila lebanonensis]|uniref:ATP-binding cassette sub-family A member 3-like n=1 Tax=Drosophila lebanonensis TaxID=7225 RepID=A0A6J2UC04_DROLE|nr:ATP-binding cassette sub-family A member 3-like [Scaptodrosophila lebanonensis]